MTELKPCPLKAWKVNPINEFYSYIVFAETKGKARSYALGLDGFEHCDFLDVEIYRCKEADCMCNGRKEMDWQNENDRLFLVKNLGWTCGEYYELDECEICVANEYCEKWQEYEKWQDSMREG